MTDVIGGKLQFQLTIVACSLSVGQNINTSRGKTYSVCLCVLEENQRLISTIAWVNILEIIKVVVVFNSNNFSNNFEVAINLLGFLMQSARINCRILFY